MRVYLFVYVALDFLQASLVCERKEKEGRKEGSLERARKSAGKKSEVVLYYCVMWFEDLVIISSPLLCFPIR